jgi:glycine hydroxymethyltransferase
MAGVLADEGLRVVSGGTDNHLILLDLTNLSLTGLEAETVLGKAHITVNKNTIPNESRSPFVTSGLRIGTPAVTTRGMKEEEMQKIGHYIARVLKNIHDDAIVKSVGAEVKEMATKFPLYPE